MFSADDYWLCYVYGGTNVARTREEWVAANESGIVNNGVQIWRRRHPPGVVVAGPVHEPFATNQVTIVRDAPGVVKIIPIAMLKAYLDSHLVVLPAH